MRKLVIGILAHVDAGKTTLAEGMLYLTGSIRKLGRVDHKDAFLDTYELERARGITIFSKQAVFKYRDVEFTLLDTPGHVDFSAEMERTLQVLDYAVMVISGSDGVQGHTETLWRLLEQYKVPVFLFVNKMDLDGTDRGALIMEIRKRLGDSCVDFGADQLPELFMENLAMCDEALLEKYIENGSLESKDITASIAERKIFPCYFGSALKLEGVEALLGGMAEYTRSAEFPEQFGAKIFKITRDEQGSRLTHMKITGGSLKVKMSLTNVGEKKDIRDMDSGDITRREAARNMDSGDFTGREAARDKMKAARVGIGGGPDTGESSQSQGSKRTANSGGPDAEESKVWEEKVNQIRIYSGSRYETTDEAQAGTICAVTGLGRTYPGEGLGMEAMSDMPILEPVLNYQVILPPECDAHSMLSRLRQLEEEDPQLHIVWSERLREIHVQLMGEVQVEILKSLVLERFGIRIGFGQGNIVYKETILEPVEGVGHFEPLRHYAEVHLSLEPNEPGSGLTFESSCSEDILDRNWQRLILTHLEEKEHVGVLTGSPITDMRITLIAGRAHIKHTEGGDFRQATYRAVRQGLKKAKSILLEPYYHYKLEIPTEVLGRAMSDIQRMSGDFKPPETDGDMSILTGCIPVATMWGYQTEMTAYTRGRGRMSCELLGYQPCHNQEEMIAAIGYDSERDTDNPTGSVFCAHGAGFIVDWDKAEDYMHVDSGYKPGKAKESEEAKELKEAKEPAAATPKASYEGSMKEDKELEEIFVRTFGPIKQRTGNSRYALGYEKGAPPDRNIHKREDVPDEKEPVKEYLLVDGYNIIFSWRELNELAGENLDAARIKLMDVLCNYQGFRKCILILVFDAYKVKGGVGEVMDYHNIHVVYTKEAETADAYIEKTTHEIAREHHVTVATSDALEQMIILGQGAIRLSANDLKEEIIRVRDQIRRDYLERQPSGRAYLKDQFGEDILDCLKEEDASSKKTK